MVDINSFDASPKIYDYENHLSYSTPNGTPEDLLKWISKIPRFTQLTINQKNWTDIPSELQSITALCEVTLNMPLLQSFPPEWIALKRLSIACKHLPMLPALLLERLKLDFNTMQEGALDSISSASLEIKSERWTGEGFQWPKGITEPSLYLNLDLPHASKEAPDLRSFKHLHNLNLHINTTRITKPFPSSIQYFYLRNEGTLLQGDAGLDQLTELRNLSVHGIFDSEFIQGISNCQKLYSISLTGLQGEYPKELHACNELRTVSIVNSTITHVPESIIRLNQIETLFLSQNKLLSSVPNDWSAMTRLRQLSLIQNSLSNMDFMETLAPSLENIYLDEKSCKNPLFQLNIKRSLPIKRNSSFENIKDLEALNLLMAALARTNYEWEDKLFFFQHFCDHEVKLIETWPLYRKIQALSITWKPIQDAAYKELLNSITKIQQAQSQHFYLDGNFAEKKNTLKEKIKQLGSTLVNDIDKASILVIGKSPSESWTWLKQNNTAVILENHLYELLKQLPEEGDKFLLEENVDTSMLEGVKSLLLSEDPSNVIIAMQSIKVGGLPDDLKNCLLYVFKSTSDTNVRNEAKKILELQSLDKWMPILRDKQSFKRSDKEKELRAKLEKLEKAAGIDITSEFALLLEEATGKGLAYVLAQKKSEYRIRALRRLTENGELNFHRGIGYHNWKNEKPTEVMLSSVKTGIAFPSDHPDVLSVKKINFHNCKFDTLSKDIKIFTETYELDLSVNNLKSLPLELKSLTKLKLLDLSLNRFVEIPSVLFEMPWLQRIDLRYNDQGALKGGATRFEKLEALKEALSGCEILA
jgi:Leucine-rich repeat (LRR) protein